MNADRATGFAVMAIFFGAMLLFWVVGPVVLREVEILLGFRDHSE